MGVMVEGDEVEGAQVVIVTQFTAITLKCSRG